MTKQTAVEWLALYIQNITSLNCDEIIEQAKEMEKELIIETFKYAQTLHAMGDETRAEQYYNKTYGGNNE